MKKINVKREDEEFRKEKMNWKRDFFKKQNKHLERRRI